MSGARAFRIAMAALCVLTAALLIAGAVGVYREGATRRAEDPLANIYTRQAVSKRLALPGALMIAIAALTLIGRLSGLGDEAPRTVGGRAAPAREEDRRARLLRAAILAAAAGLILAGILNGSARDVFYKAANICTECVGLG